MSEYVEVVPDLDAARDAVLARIPEGSVVMTNTSMTLQETGIAAAIDDGGPYESARNKMMALDFATQLQQMKAIAGQPDYALGSVHAVSRDTEGLSSPPPPAAGNSRIGKILEIHQEDPGRIHVVLIRQTVGY